MSTVSKVYELPKLGFELSALEPVITAEMMDFHYNKHHNTYTQNLNNLLKQYDDAEKANNIEKMTTLLNPIKFNGGGYINHKIFWESLAPKDQGGGSPPTGKFAEAIKKDFGSFENLIDKLSAKSIAVQGSGWGWLGWNKDFGRLEITTTFNQDLLTNFGLDPLLCIDVWEHAYYIKYKNARANFVKDIWQIINWPGIENKYNSLI